MANQFKVCNRCKATSIDTLLPRLKEIDNEAEIIIGCQGFCGIGGTKSFAIINNIPIITDSEDDLIEKIKTFLKK